MGPWSGSFEHQPLAVHQVMPVRRHRGFPELASRAFTDGTAEVDARTWLRINRVLRAILHERWSAEAWPQVKAEFKKALALKSQIRRAGWFN